MRYFTHQTFAMICLALASAICSGPISFTQDQPSAESATLAADQAYEPIARDLRNLYDSLTSQRGLNDESRPILVALRERAAAFTAQYPNDPRGPAVELVISRWLGERDRIKAAMQRLIAADPSNANARVLLGKHYKSTHQYQSAIDVLNVSQIEPAKHPEATLVLADCLFAAQRFEESLSTMNSIPAETLEANLDLKLQADVARKTREEYVIHWSEEQAIREAEASADDLPRVMLLTNKGPIVIELFENQAPNTVANFISLVEKSFYNGTTFHDVSTAGFVAGGDPNTKDQSQGAVFGRGNPGYFIAAEHGKPEARKCFAGSIAMLPRDAADTAGSVFGIATQPIPHFNGRNTVFGRVIEGMDVLTQLEKGDLLQIANVVRKRAHDYVPETLPLSAAPARPTIINPETGQPMDIQLPEGFTLPQDLQTPPQPVPVEPQEDPAPDDDTQEQPADTPAEEPTPD